MKKYGIYLLLFFLLIFSYIGFDLFVSIVIKKDNNLEVRIVSEIDYTNLQREYDDLVRKVSLNNILEQEVQISKVILHDPYLFFDSITILKGKNDNMEVGDIVYDENGYIGEISATKDNYSQVTLVTNKDIKLSVKVNNSYGVLKKDGEDFIVENITSKEEIKENDIVYTSSFSTVGLEMPVAKVLEVKNNGIEQKLIIESLVNINDLNYVLIRKKNNNE